MRKRIGALMLAGAIAACSTVGWAEETSGTGIDLSSYTLDQLVELRNEINELLSDNFGAPNYIGQGAYEAGVDIKTGYFSISCSPNTEGGEMTIYSYKTREDYENSKNVEFSQIVYNKENPELSERVTIYLEEGNVIKLTGEGIIEETAKPSWAM